MSDIVFNIAKGRVAELYNRVKTNDPANSAIIIVPIDRGATTDATFKDHDTLAAVLAAATERTTGGWGRKTLTDVQLAALTVDDTNDRMPCAFPEQSWATVTAGNTTDLVFCYDGDTAAGTDANIVPLTLGAFTILADGSTVVLPAGDFFRAS